MSSSITSFKLLAGSRSTAWLLTALSLSALGCGAADPTELGSAGAEAASEPGVGSTQQPVAAGCIRGESRQAVGSSYDLLAGRVGSFAFTDDFSACESGVGRTYTNTRLFSDAYEFERAMTSSVSVEGSGSYGPYSASASLKQTVESRVKFSRNSIVLLAEEEITNAQVTLDASARYVPDFENKVAAGDKLGLHNAYGDAFIKTAYLGHSIKIIYKADYERTDKYRKEDFQAVLKASYTAAANGGSVTVSGFSSSQVSEMTSKMNISVLAITSSTNSTSSANVLDIQPDLTLADVKGVLASFRQNARASKGGTIRTELVPFGQQGGKTEAQFFDWRSRVASIDVFDRYYNRAKQVADLGTKYKDLANRANDGMTGAQWYIDQYRSPAGYQGSGQGAAAFGNFIYTLTQDATQYLNIVGQSQRLVGTRLGNVCVSVADGSAGSPGAQLAVKPCSSDDGQLFRFVSTAPGGRSGTLLSVSGDCVDVSGGYPTGGLVLASCATPSSATQRWTFSTGTRKISAFTEKVIAFVSNDSGGLFKGAPNQSLNAAGWSRDDYRQYQWEKLY